MAYETISGDTVPFNIIVNPPGSAVAAKIQVFPFHSKEPVLELSEADCTIDAGGIRGEFASGAPGLYWFEVELISTDGKVRTTTALVEVLEGRIQ